MSRLGDVAFAAIWCPIFAVLVALAVLVAFAAVLVLVAFAAVLVASPVLGVVWLVDRVGWWQFERRLARDPELAARHAQLIHSMTEGSRGD